MADALGYGVAERRLSRKALRVANEVDPATLDVHDNPVRVVASEHNLDVPGGRNLGLSSTTAEVVFFLDDDAEVISTDLEHRASRRLQLAISKACESRWTGGHCLGRRSQSARPSSDHLTETGAWAGTTVLITVRRYHRKMRKDSPVVSARSSPPPFVASRVDVQRLAPSIEAIALKSADEGIYGMEPWILIEEHPDGNLIEDNSELPTARLHIVDAMLRARSSLQAANWAGAHVRQLRGRLPSSPRQA